MILLIAYSDLPAISAKEMIEYLASKLPEYSLIGLHRNKTGAWEACLKPLAKSKV